MKTANPTPRQGLGLIRQLVADEVKMKRALCQSPGHDQNSRKNCLAALRKWLTAQRNLRAILARKNG